MTKIDKDKKDRSSINPNDEYEKTDYFRTFKFIEKMRNLLESKQTDIISWINIIFGSGQKHKNGKDKEYFFKCESYIDYTTETKEKLQECRNNKLMLTNVEFGVTPIQIVFEGNIGKNRNKNNPYNLTVKENKDKFIKICQEYIDKIKPPTHQRKKSFLDKFASYQIFKNLILKKINIDNDDNSNNMFKITNENKINENNSDIINNIFVDSEKYIKYIYQNKKIKIIGYKTGKSEVLSLNENRQFELVNELFDHKYAIKHINYNQRLNMICTTSKDGYINIYSFPNKLITTIKNPHNSTFDLVFLCSNPFPALIALEKENMWLYSYTINGFKIKDVNLYKLLEIEENIQKDLYIVSNFNEKGGTFKDRLILIENDIVTITEKEKEKEKDKDKEKKKDKKKEKEKEKKKEKEKVNVFKCSFIKVPFFEKEEIIIDLKQK